MALIVIHIPAHVVFPELNILIDGHLEMMAIEEDELTGHENHSFRGVSAEELIAMEQELDELTRDDPVDKGTEEVTITKLNDTLGHHALRRSALVQRF